MNNKPDIKVMFQPGGKSNFSFGWTKPEEEAPKKPNNNQENKVESKKMNGNFNEDEEDKPEKKQVKTSVKVHAPPGGKSNFTFG